MKKKLINPQATLLSQPGAELDDVDLARALVVVSASSDQKAIWSRQEFLRQASRELVERIIVGIESRRIGPSARSIYHPYYPEYERDVIEVRRPSKLVIRKFSRP